jgi:hypothetical protein
MVPSGALTQRPSGVQPRVEIATLASVTRPVHLVLIAALSGPAISGCATEGISLAEGPREYVATDYDTILNRWTRTEHLFGFSELEDVLTATATFESWDFRWAYVIRYVEDYRLTIDQRQRLLDQALAETHEHHQFFVALAGGDRRADDLSKPDSAWIVRLIDDTGNETAPESITTVKRNNTLERTYFPYNSPWRSAFRVRFPRVTADGKPTIAPDAKWIGLRFAGAQGASELYWQVGESVAKASP